MNIKLIIIIIIINIRVKDSPNLIKIMKISLDGA